MKKLQKNLLLPAVMLSLALPSLTSFAERMDEDTHSLIISKLEYALKNGEKASSEKNSLTLRLADLYADRARLQLIKNGDADCNNCESDSKDRKRAVELYQQVVKTLPLPQQALIHVQMGYLQQQLKQDKAALDSFTLATKNSSAEPEVKAQAHSAVGDIHFRDNKFKLAESHYRQALSAPNFKHKTLAQYRLAWCLLNQGKQKLATQTMLDLLKSPANFSGAAQELHSDIVNDLVLFVARGEIDATTIDKMVIIAPENSQSEWLYNLAQELERLGKKSIAIVAWNKFSQHPKTSPETLAETQIRVAQLTWDLGNRDASLATYQQALENWSKNSCKGENCEELKKRFKNYITTWNRVEKESPSDGCLKAYKAYLTVFNTDADMFYKAATVAEQRKDYRSATNLYAQAVAVVKDQPEKKLLEPAILKQIENAELSRDAKLRLAAYNSYLELLPKGERYTEVRYQKANVYYETNDSQNAFPLFLALATDGTDNREIRTKAADLALDTLALQKKHSELFDLSNKLAEKFPERRAHYTKIQRESAIFLAVSTLNDKDSSQSDYRSELDRIRLVSLSTATDKEKITTLKNRLALAERTRNIAEVDNTANLLLTINTLSAADREMALGRKVWVAELRLDFKSALKLSQQLNFSGRTEEYKQLRLATLSELAGVNPTPHYKYALHVVRDPVKANGIRASLIRLAKDPWSEIRRYRRELESSPDLFLTLVLEAHERRPNRNNLESYAHNRSLKRTYLGQFVRRQEFIENWRTFDRKIAAHRLNKKSDRALQNTLRDRIYLLGQADRMGQKAINSGDWISQLAALTTIQRENDRLYNEIIKLPAPKNLRKSDRERYAKLLNDKAEAFQKKATQVERKADEFWDNRSSWNQLESTLSSARPEARNLLVADLETLKRIAPRHRQSQITSMLSDRPDMPSASDLNQAKNRVAHSPFDVDLTQNLKKIAQRRGQYTLAAYLDARTTELAQNGGLR